MSVSLVDGDILFIRKTPLHLRMSCPMIILLPKERVTHI